jgi:hypothetical protein
VVNELLRAWPTFDPEEYAKCVLSHYPLNNDRLLTIDDLRLIPGLKHLSRLAHLIVSNTDDHALPLDFVRELPALRRLSVDLTADLTPLAGTALEDFSTFYRTPDPLDLTPLARTPGLTSVATTRPVSGIAALRTLERLSDLYLWRLGTEAAIDELRAFVTLTSVAVGHLRDLHTLDPLGFLTDLQWLGLDSCPVLHDLTALRRWSRSMVGLVLDLCPLVDLAPLADLTEISFVRLSECGKIDLAPVALMPHLSTLVLAASETAPLPDLAPLRKAPALRQVNIFSPGEVDLSALSSVERLTVTVDRKTIVHGADGLGAGSRVRWR